MTDEYSEFFTDLNSVDTAFDGFTELGRHGHSLLGRIVRHGQIWFVKSYILRDAAEAELRIRKEYELLLKLNHPGVVRAGWLFRMPDAGLCLAMEYLDGERLDMFLKHASKIERKRISDSLLQTMAYVHARNICHLDLKPANILVTGHGNLTAIKIIDFGMADSPGSALFKNPVRPNSLKRATPRRRAAMSTALENYCCLLTQGPLTATPQNSRSKIAILNAPLMLRLLSI